MRTKQRVFRIQWNVGCCCEPLGFTDRSIGRLLNQRYVLATYLSSLLDELGQLSEEL